MADQTSTPSVQDILSQLPKLNISSTSFVRSSNEGVHKSSSPSGPALPSSGIWTFDTWVDYLSSKAGPTSLSPAIHSLALLDHDSISDTHEPPSSSPSSLAPSYNEILDQYFPSVPSDDDGKNANLHNKQGKTHNSSSQTRCLIVGYSIASCTITNIRKGTCETKTHR